MIEHGLADLKEHPYALEKHIKPKTVSKMRLEVIDAVCSEVISMLFTQDNEKTRCSI